MRNEVMKMNCNIMQSRVIVPRLQRNNKEEAAPSEGFKCHQLKEQEMKNHTLPLKGLTAREHFLLLLLLLLFLF